MMVLFCGNSAARSLALREGVGSIRHLHGKLFWLQQKTKAGCGDDFLDQHPGEPCGCRYESFDAEPTEDVTLLDGHAGWR
jgi:hypothetical protein